MPDQKTHLNADRALRAAHLRAAMATLEKEIQKISKQGEIDSLQRTIESLKESWLDVCTGAEIEQTPAKSPQSD